MPLIWDNLFANDYDIRRLHCGPYAGRSPELRDAVRGILINPNNEYLINNVPLRTFSQVLKVERDWNPREAYLSAISEWHSTFATVARPLQLDDLILLADCFYLPHTTGSEADKLLALIGRLSKLSAEEWGGDYENFCDFNSRIQQSFERLTELRDRDLFDAWSRYAWQLKEEMQLIALRFEQKKAGRTPLGSDPQLPEQLLGGTLAKLERMHSV
jgi:protein O-GlcNAcase/histone acetyltransferase